MICTSFQVKKKLEKPRFFLETFPIADTSVKMILGMLFLSFSNGDMKFVDKKLTWRVYNASKALRNTKYI